MDTLDHNEATAAKKEQQEKLLQEMELRRKLKGTVVPTNVQDVRNLLRQLGEPVTLFGEREMERRERLRKIMAAMDADAVVTDQLEAPRAAPGPAKPSEVFYTEGGEGLREARLEIARFSLERAAQRLAAAKRKRASPDEDEAAEAAGTEAACRHIAQQSSEIGDDRPISGAAFSPDGAWLATAAWSGLLKLWAMPGCTKEVTVKAHEDRITGLAWHPHADPGANDSATVCLATGSADTSARLWSAGGAQLRILAGHTDRLGRIAFHPAGRQLATASFDATWRLWDVEAGACLVEQEGHSRAVYTVGFQGDGALAASGGMDAIGRIWDMRTGRSIMVLEGHVKGILALDWAPCGHQLATGSEDHTARVWDLRTRRCLYTIPAHKSLISQVRYEPVDGHVLLTGGYDNVCKLWSMRDFRLLRTLAGHEGKVMGADICPDQSGLMASVAYDRTIKLWAPSMFGEELVPEEGAAMQVDAEG